MENKITIIIPSKNEEENIKNLLSEIHRQSVGNMRIILADANSSDRTVEFSKKESQRLGLNLEIIEGGTPAEGRNRGADLSETKYVLFLDSDVTFTKKFSLRECLESVENGGYELFSSTPVFRGGINLRARFLLLLNKIGTIWMSKKMPFAIGAFTLIKRERFYRIGKYDVTLKHTEDWIMSKKIRPDKFLLVPDLITQDDRRFKKFGYSKMCYLILLNLINRNNTDHFKKEMGYWDHYKK
jgi:glycosyltransferase involved in cell wall biosynthesis